MPRSLAFCCERMEDNLAQLQRHYGEETEAWRQAHRLCHDKLAGPIQSIFDGSVRHLDEAVPFSVAGTVTILPDGTAAITITDGS